MYVDKNMVCIPSYSYILPCFLRAYFFIFLRNKFLKYTR